MIITMTLDYIKKHYKDEITNVIITTINCFFFFSFFTTWYLKLHKKTETKKKIN